MTDTPPSARALALAREMDHVAHATGTQDATPRQRVLDEAAGEPTAGQLPPAWAMEITAGIWGWPSLSAVPDIQRNSPQFIRVARALATERRAGIEEAKKAISDMEYDNLWGGQRRIGWDIGKEQSSNAVSALLDQPPAKP